MQKVARKIPLEVLPEVEIHGLEKFGPGDDFIFKFEFICSIWIIVSPCVIASHLKILIIYRDTCP